MYEKEEPPEAPPPDQTALRPVISCTTSTTNASTNRIWIRLPTAAPANPKPNAHKTTSTIKIVQSIDLLTPIYYFNLLAFDGAEPDFADAVAPIYFV